MKILKEGKIVAIRDIDRKITGYRISEFTIDCEGKDFDLSELSKFITKEVKKRNK